LTVSRSNEQTGNDWAAAHLGEIDLDALAHNLGVIRKQVGPETKIMAAVKANAYGHGAVECARRLEAEGVDWFGVALPEEGIELRESGFPGRFFVWADSGRVRNPLAFSIS
jgi:alanine racemase